MKKTFVCNESMIITIPIGSLRNAGEGQLMPDNFTCVYRDSYKVFVVRGKPKPLGAAQAIAGVFILTLGLAFAPHDTNRLYALPSVWFVVTGLLSYAAGQFPNMHVTKLSLSLNIISFLWSIVAVILYIIYFGILPKDRKVFYDGIIGLIVTLLGVENIIALFLIYWSSEAVCRKNFNTLPTILLKQVD